MSPKKSAKKDHKKTDLIEDVSEITFDIISKITGFSKETVINYILNQDSVSYLLGGKQFIYVFDDKKTLK